MTAEEALDRIRRDIQQRRSDERKLIKFKVCYAVNMIAILTQLLNTVERRNDFLGVESSE